MVKALIAVVDYPRLSGERAMAFVHVRNRYYLAHGIDVTVLNYSAREDYILDDVRVVTLDSYKSGKKEYDIFIAHAANIRNHYIFLKKYERCFKNIIFVFHGHEILRINKAYPRPYEFCRDGFLNYIFQDCYDSFKLNVWRHYYPHVFYKTHFVFVSHWIFNEFLSGMNTDIYDFSSHVHIIHNSVGQVFEKTEYNYKEKKEFDFITVRSNMDDSKYGMDLVVKLAKRYKNNRFLVIGKGDFFKYYDKPQNLVWIDQTLSHKGLLEYMDKSSCALLLTRQDTQGVMACECATYGMPVITSSIEICKEIFEGFDNVDLISNDVDSVDLEKIVIRLNDGLPYKKNTKYFAENTIQCEVDLIKKLLQTQ